MCFTGAFLQQDPDVAATLFDEVISPPHPHTPFPPIHPPSIPSSFRPFPPSSIPSTQNSEPLSLKPGAQAKNYF